LGRHKIHRNDKKHEKMVDCFNDYNKTPGFYINNLFVEELITIVDEYFCVGYISYFIMCYAFLNTIYNVVTAT
jgi:hypothetical protein